ncbi:MAG: hypothetical protein ICV78_23290 [Tolypothrix sp. Co-bin9]|nr:hypothetical protein [Tolypothrix sp. Co-bin9]
MKFQTYSLPNPDYFTPLEPTKKGLFLWEDKANPLVRLRSPVPDPWAKSPLVILPTIEKAKTDNKEYPSRITFKLFLPSEKSFPKAKLMRLRYRGNFVHFYRDNLPGMIAMYVFPTDQQKIWLVYYFTDHY